MQKDEGRKGGIAASTIEHSRVFTVLPVAFKLCVPVQADDALARLRSRASWQSTWKPPFRPRFYGRVRGSRFRLRFSSGRFTTGEPTLKGEVTGEENRTILQGQIRLGFMMILSGVMIVLICALGVIGLTRGEGWSWILFVLCGGLMMLELWCYRRNSKQALSLLEAMVTEPEF